ncbi:MAG: hypothetical protein JXR21_01560 [Candidatus Marinimicrobia bacterium]|nr:hypothetical protein [Candidatus Neomarinimicrobiota bacterium]
MKRLAGIAIFLMLLSCSSVDKKTDLESYELKGKVNHVTIRHYDAVEKDGEVVKGDRDLEKSNEGDQTVSFDKKGYITGAYFYGETDSSDSKTLRYYNVPGKCAREINYNGNGEVVSDWVWSYDRKGNQTGRSRYKADSSLVQLWFLHYDEDNKLISRAIYWEPGSLYDSLYWIYNDAGKQIEERSFGYYGLRYISRIEYEGEHIRNIFRYDENDELIGFYELNYNEDALLSAARIYTVDTGEEAEADTVLQAEHRFEYEKDPRGNWIVKIEYRNDEPYIYYERRIIYY